MFFDICALIFSLIGAVSIIYFINIKLLSWKEESFNIVLPLYSENDDIKEHIYNIRSLFEMVGIEKKLRLTIVNYGAPEWYCQKLLKDFEAYPFINITNSEINL